MKVLLFLIFFLLIFSGVDAGAACPTNIEGQSETHKVVIAQDCDMESEIHIFGFDANKNEYSIEKPVILLKSECEETYKETNGKSIMLLTCKNNGKTILSGAVYKPTMDGMPNCPGESFAVRYTCIKGCNKNAPKYLSIGVYEC